ncbi:MAG: Holliday junction branch migration protein RuvA [Firmicutes bacterium]|nr:Holliday junction branch migration protein RuvA [Bacillota bacterium]
MIGFVRGKVISCEEGIVLIENNGIGYEINISDISEFDMYAGSSEEITVYTAMMVREDDISLCGFRKKADLEMFKKLLTVNGVGTKAALAILGVMKAEELSRAIVFEDTDSIVRAPGIGKKTAQRIVLELKDKLGDISGFSKDEREFSTDAVMKGAAPDAKTEALQALIALGYSKSEGAAALSKIKEEYTDTQEYIKQALAKLM